MWFDRSCVRVPQWVQIATLAFLLYTAPVRTAKAEGRLDFKALHYQEDDDRMRVLAPALLYEQSLGTETTIKIEFIYNSISGATPTGAPRPVTRTATPQPPAPALPAPRPRPRPGDDDDDDREAEDRRLTGLLNGAGDVTRPVNTIAGATPAPGPTPTPPPAPGPAPAPATNDIPVLGPLPMAEVEDTRVGLSIEATHRMGAHTFAGQIAYSTEEDFQSIGLSIRDSVDFNQKNTTLVLGAAYTHDIIDVGAGTSARERDTVDVMIGLVQLLGPKAFVSLNLTWGSADGYLSDPYKVAELNGSLVREIRPEQRDRWIAMVTLARYIESLNASVEGSFRHYADTFGIQSGTVSLAWRQRLLEKFTLSPFVRFYRQTAADFYDVRFTGSPEHYSADYRLSAFDAVSLGLKVVWQASERVAFDLGYERYVQSGTDDRTPDEAYTSANIVTGGARVWF